MEVADIILLGEAVRDLGWDPLWEWDGFYLQDAEAIDADRTCYALVRKGGLFGTGTRLLGKALLERDGTVLVKVAGRENAAELEDLAAALGDRLGRPWRTVLEQS